MTVPDLVGQTMRDGYFVLSGFLSVADVVACREQLVEILEEDLAGRKNNGITSDSWCSKQGFLSEFTREMHNCYFASWRSPILAKIIVDILSHDIIAEFMRQVVGEHYRLRLDLVRCSSGVLDIASDGGPPHTWHRDTPGEFTFGIFFDEMNATDSGGTCVIQGTHLSSYHALWDLALSEETLISERRYHDGRTNSIPANWRRLLSINRALRQKMAPRTRELHGTIGDIYFFFNDTWHGRAPNTTGKALTTVRFGGFPTDYSFRDNIPLPTGVEKLPSLLRKVYSAGQPINDPSALIHKNRTMKPLVDLVRLAHLEKKLLVRLMESSSVI